MGKFSINRRLKSDFTWALSGNVLYSACQWGIVLILAKLGSPEQVGEYALGLAVSAPIIVFANFQLRVLLASDVKGQFRFGQYLTFRMLSMGAALLAVAVLVAFTQPDPRHGGVILLVGLATAIEYLGETYYGLMQKFDRMDRVSRSLMLKGPLSLAALGAAMYFTHSVVWAVAGLALGRLLVLLTWDTRLGFAGHNAGAPPARLEWKSEEMLAMLRMALPLGFVSMLNALNTSVPRYFIEAHWGSAELGIFSAIASLMSAGSLIVSAFGQSILVPVARACDASDRSEFRGFVLQAIALGAVLGGGAVAAAGLFGRQILTQLFRPEYAANNDIFFRLMVAGTVMFIACGLGFVMTAARSLKPQLPLLLLTVLAAAAVSAYSIPTNGLRGAADAALASALVQLAGSVLILLRIDRQLKKDSSPKFDMYVPATAESEALEATTR